MKNNTEYYYSPKQGRLPLFLADSLDICDPVLAFDQIMEKFKELYGFYSKYPVADAGYGSFNNYIYCQECGMEKYMKFPIYKKETKDKGYHDDPLTWIRMAIWCVQEGRNSILPIERL